MAKDLDEILDHCAMEIATICAQNETIMDRKDPFLCRVQSDSNVNVNASDLATDCMSTVRDLYSKSTASTRNVHIRNKPSILQNQMKKFALELHDALMTLPDDIQTELHGTREKLLLSPRVKVKQQEQVKHIEIPLSPRQKAKPRSLILTPRSQRKASEVKIQQEKAQTIVDVQENIVPYRRESNPLVQSFIEQRKIKQREILDKKKLQRQASNARVWETYREEAIKSHVDRQREARERKEMQLQELQDQAKAREKIYEKRISSSKSKRTYAWTDNPSSYLSQFKRNGNVNVSEDSVGGLKKKVARAVRVCVYKVGERDEKQHVTVSDWQSLYDLTLQKLNLEDITEIKRERAKVTSTGEFSKFQRVSTFDQLRTGDMLCIVSGNEDTSSSESKPLKQATSCTIHPLKRQHQVSWDSNGRCLLFSPHVQ